MKLTILFLEPFFGGSHRDFAQGLLKHSRHSFDLLTLPSRFWKWRMRGAALYFYDKIDKQKQYDLILTTDLMSTADLKALIDPLAPPIVLYFHENQLSYPLPEGVSMNYQSGFTDITSALAAEEVIFNSYFHQQEFFSTLPRFLRQMPEYRPYWVTDTIRKKSSVLYPGCMFPGINSISKEEEQIEAGDRGVPPLIIWNHRWEYDKNPDHFFRVLKRIKNEHIPFRLALLGESFRRKPSAFLEAKEVFSEELVRFGYIEEKEEYIQLLKQGSIVISTAIQENFGISIVEAVRYGCFPLLPRRLAYPELIPEQFRAQVLYDTASELYNKCRQLLLGEREKGLPGPFDCRRELIQWASRFSWENRIEDFDSFFERRASKASTHV